MTMHPKALAAILDGALVSSIEDVKCEIYSAERSIIDAFRMRGREGHDVANEALKRWLRRRGSQPSALLQIAKALPRSEGPLRHALEVLL